MSHSRQRDKYGKSPDKAVTLSGLFIDYAVSSPEEVPNIKQTTLAAPKQSTHRRTDKKRVLIFSSPYTLPRSGQRSCPSHTCSYHTPRVPLDTLLPVAILTLTPHITTTKII